MSAIKVFEQLFAQMEQEMVPRPLEQRLKVAKKMVKTIMGDHPYALVTVEEEEGGRAMAMAEVRGDKNQVAEAMIEVTARIIEDQIEAGKLTENDAADVLIAQLGRTVKPRELTIAISPKFDGNGDTLLPAIVGTSEQSREPHEQFAKLAKTLQQGVFVKKDSLKI